ncbi:PREDICTED: uncharacterized protein LOC101301751 [Fragaria vesca subsp. vesca]
MRRSTDRESMERNFSGFAGEFLIPATAVSKTDAGNLDLVSSTSLCLQLAEMRSGERESKGGRFLSFPTLFLVFRRASNSVQLRVRRQVLRNHQHQVRGVTLANLRTTTNIRSQMRPTTTAVVHRHKFQIYSRRLRRVWDVQWTRFGPSICVGGYTRKIGRKYPRDVEVMSLKQSNLGHHESDVVQRSSEMC